MKQCRVLCVVCRACSAATQLESQKYPNFWLYVSFLFFFFFLLVSSIQRSLERRKQHQPSWNNFIFLRVKSKRVLSESGYFHSIEYHLFRRKPTTSSSHTEKKQETIEWRSSQVRRRRRLKRVMWYVLCSRWWRNVINIEPNLVLEVKSSNRYTYKALCAILKESLANKSKNNNNERSRQFWVFHSCDLCAFCCALTNKNIQLIECHRKIITQIDSRKSFIASAIIIHPSIRRWVAAQEEEKRDP